MATLCLRIDVPISSFRPYASREYQDTYPAPPPATIFGMLLSYMGVEREGAWRFAGNHIGIAIEGEADLSQVLRKMRRDGNTQKGPKRIPKYRPEYQELLSDLVVYCLIDDQKAQQESLVELMSGLMEHPEHIERYGSLSLGESSHLVDSIGVCEAPEECLVLQPQQHGILVMPIWTNFQDRSATKFQRFELIPGPLNQAEIPLEPKGPTHL